MGRKSMQLKSVWNGDLDDTIVYYCTGDAVTIRRVENSRNFHFPQFGFTEEVEWCIPDINLFMVLEINFMGGVRACLGTLDLSNISMLPPFAMTYR